MVNHDHSANRSVLGYLGGEDRLRRSVSAAKHLRGCSPDGVHDPYTRLGTHPDLVTRLWDELGSLLPADCRHVVFGAPALVRPDSGVVFGFAGGTLTYALRLPPEEHAAAISAGAEVVHHYRAYPALSVEATVLDLRALGRGWVFGGWYEAENTWVRAAYSYAGQQDRRPRP